MANIITHKRSALAGAVPTAAQLASGELAINTTDGKIFLRKADNTVVALNDYVIADGGEFPFDPRELGGLALWLDAADPGVLYTTDAGPVTAVSSPLDIAGCALWLDADHAASITESGGLVSQWNDRSGNSRHATASSTARPTTGTRTVGGKNAIDFNGTSNVVALTGSAVPTAATHTVFLVYQLDSAAQSRFSTLLCANPAGAQEIRVAGFGSTVVDFFYSGNLARQITSIALGLGPVLFSTREASNSLRSSGASVFASSVSPTPTAWATSGLTLGGRATSAFVDGLFCEVIIYPTTLTDSQTASVEAYLAAKWGIANVHTPATAASDPVGAWLDKSGNNRHAVQATAGSRPVVGTLNGRKTLSANGTSHEMALTNAGDVTRKAPGVTIIAALTPNTVTSIRSAVFFSVGPNASARTLLQFNIAELRAGGRRLDADSFDSATGGTIVANQPIVAVARFDYANAIAAAFSNSALLATDTSFLTAGLTSDTASQAAAIMNTPGGSLFYSGIFAELLVYDRAVTTAERRKAEIYLARKWGIALAPQVANADAQDWVNRVYANGGSVSPSTATAVNTFCNAIDAASIRDRFFRLNMFCGTGLNAALVPLYRGQSLGGSQFGNTTDTNNGPFAIGDYTETGASGGLKGNGSTKNLDTGLAGTTFSAGDRHCSAYWNANATLTGNRVFIGNTDATTTAVGAWFDIHSRHANPGSEAQITNNHALAHTAANRHQLTQYNGAQSAVSYSDGGDKQIRTTFPLGVPTASATNWFVFSINPGLFGGVRTDARICNYSVGLSMTDANALAFYNAVHAFQTALTRQA